MDAIYDGWWTCQILLAKLSSSWPNSFTDVKSMKVYGQTPGDGNSSHDPLGMAR